PPGWLGQGGGVSFEHGRAADGELLLLPSREIAAAAIQHLLQDGEQIEDLGRDGSGAVLPYTQADSQVFFDRELRENLASLGNVSDPQPRAAVRRKAP